MGCLPAGCYGFTAIARNGHRVYGVVRASNRESATDAVKRYMEPAEVAIQIRANTAITHKQLLGKERGHLIDATAERLPQ